MFGVFGVVMVKGAAGSGKEDEQESYSGDGHVAVAAVEYLKGSLAAAADGQKGMEGFGTTAENEDYGMLDKVESWRGDRNEALVCGVQRIE